MTRFYENLSRLVLSGALLFGSRVAANAQQSGDWQQEEIPSRYPSPVDSRVDSRSGGPQQGQGNQGAARVSFIHGDVTTRRGDTGEWVTATLNTPVVPGDHLAAGRGSRAELQLDHANILRLSDGATANVASLSRSQIQLQIAQGLVNFDVLKGGEAQVEIQTPNVSIRPNLSEGSYRIQVTDGQTIMDVRRGSAEISTPQGSTRVERDQRITIEGSTDDAQYQVSNSYSKDDWDKWNNDRDHVIEGADSWRHTNRYYTGSQDLDTYGHWSDVPDYGSVWFPQANDGWAPYRDGRWAYEPYYGWTWVSSEPWGWAPYHYGRWFVYGGNWGWWPGPVYGGYRPVWAPAYVSFLGFGGGGFGASVGFGFGGGFGSVGWLPCGPGDRFYPWYGRGVNQININVNNYRNYGGGYAALREGPRGYSNVEGAFRDGRIRDGVSSMGAGEFGRGRVPLRQQRLDEGSFRQASVMTGSLPVQPSRESMRFSDRQVNPTSIPNAGNSNQRFYSDARPSGNVQGERAQRSLGYSGNSGGGQQQQTRPGFRNFGSGNSGNSSAPNIDRGNRGPQANDQGQQRSDPRQQINDQRLRSNTPDAGQQQARPGFRNFGSGNLGNSSAPNTDRGNRGPQGNDMRQQSGDPRQQINDQRLRSNTPDAGQQQARPGFRNFGSGNSNAPNIDRGNRGPQANDQGQLRSDPRQQINDQRLRSNTPDAGQQQARPGFRNFEMQGSPNGGASNQSRGAQPSMQQTRPSYSPNSEPSRQYRSSEPARQYQNDSRGSSGGYGSSRPPLNMQQPVMTPRGGGGSGYSSEPRNSGGGYRGPSGASSSSGGSRGSNGSGSSRGGDHSSSSHDHK